VFVFYSFILGKMAQHGKSTKLSDFEIL